MKVPQKIKKVSLVAAVSIAALLCAVMVLVTGCFGGDSGSSSGSRIHGSVSSFDGRLASYTPGDKESRQAGLLYYLCEILIPTAEAGTAGVAVSVAGTDISTTTNPDGDFVLTGIPEGAVLINFSYGGETYSYQLNVPANATIGMENVTISGGSVSVGKIEVEVEDDNNDGIDDDLDDSQDDDVDDGVDDGQDDDIDNS